MALMMRVLGVRSEGDNGDKQIEVLLDSKCSADIRQTNTFGGVKGMIWFGR